MPSPRPSTKMAIGSFLSALSYLLLVAAAAQADLATASWLWLLAYFVVITIGELICRRPPWRW